MVSGELVGEEHDARRDEDLDRLRREPPDAEHGERERHAVRERERAERGHQRREPPPGRAHHEQQPEHEEEMVRAEEDVLDAERKEREERRAPAAGSRRTTGSCRFTAAVTVRPSARRAVTSASGIRGSSPSRRISRPTSARSQRICHARTTSSAWRSTIGAPTGRTRGEAGHERRGSTVARERVFNVARTSPVAVSSIRNAADWSS